MKDGLFLEMLVECLGKLLVPQGISVTRDEKFYNERGIQIAQVDIVIRGQFGSTYRVIGIECRNRNERGDRPWIQQIVGRRIDLEKFGFTHWMAVSYDGFVSTAKEFAEEQNIELLVPGKVEPLEPEKYGFHNWLEYSLSYPTWEGPVKAKIAHDSSKVLDKLEKLIKKKSLMSCLIYTSTSNLLPLSNFIQSQVQAHQNSKLIHLGEDSREVKVFKFDKLKANMKSIDLVLLQETLPKILRA